MYREEIRTTIQFGDAIFGIRGAFKINMALKSHFSSQSAPPLSLFHQIRFIFDSFLRDHQVLPSTVFTHHIFFQPKSILFCTFHFECNSIFSKGWNYLFKMSSARNASSFGWNNHLSHRRKTDRDTLSAKKGAGRRPARCIKHQDYRRRVISRSKDSNQITTTPSFHYFFLF